MLEKCRFCLLSSSDGPKGNNLSTQLLSVSYLEKEILVWLGVLRFLQ